MEFDSMLAGLREKNFAAQREFVRNYHVHLSRACQARLRTSPVGKELPAEDLYQMTMLDFFRLIRRGGITAREPAHLAALLTTMAGRLVSHAERDGVAALRDARRKVSLAIDQLAILSRERDPGDAAAVKEIAERCLAAISAQDQKIVLLAAAGQSFNKIAAALGIKPGAVKGHYHRAMKTLLAAYKRLVPDE